MSAETRKTLRDAWSQTKARLEQAGVEEAAADAELLLLHLLGKSKAELLRDWREPWPAGAGLDAAWEELLRRRGSGEPVQYVTGEQYFYGRRFEVGPQVLIPRPETELLAEAVLLEADRQWPAGSGAVPRVLDVGTGSGALSVTLAAERPTWRVTASDLSADALGMAKRNAAALLGAEERIRFVQGDLLEPFMAEAGGEPIDVLVSNPPYIASGEMPDLQREVRDFEPHLALDGGDDGLTPYRRMAEQLGRLPQLPQIVAWEVGAGQAEDVAALLREAADWERIRFVVDYAGINRHVIAVR
ncbi:peptide chain release factor N(5)-glutamine methyltransferase [Cohnella candidum]|uniref:Release factor glutamine methyltransferase n=1 Tax=Cohnella candidum TaxID=2674991 RepID=A0A3G3K1A5_9BACL|nr:peptide chain release factor N(5)-glutamine methyltransferase [Cohnella candidum]AYQ74238.1 peptide chain release factor N(5)-glutamine methyltransferase [Cohnella candidum]